MAPDYLPIVYEELSTNPTHRDAVVNAFVFVHQTLHQANTRITKRGGRTMAITPRHYLDFINHFVSKNVFTIFFLLMLLLSKFTERISRIW